MGTGYSFRCHRCGNREKAYLGVGMRYPENSRETKKKAMEGKFGEEWERFIKLYPAGVFDCEKAIYLCKCGHWQQEPKMNYYIKNDEKEIIDYYWNMEYGIKCIKHFVHHCPECGKRMRRAAPEKETLKCKVCGFPMKVKQDFLWD